MSHGLWAIRGLSDIQLMSDGRPTDVGLTDSNVRQTSHELLSNIVGHSTDV